VRSVTEEEAAGGGGGEASGRPGGEERGVCGMCAVANTVPRCPCRFAKEVAPCRRAASVLHHD